MNQDLLPCPFCGGGGKVVQTKDLSGYFYAECSKCFMRQLAYSKEKTDAENRWNHRFNPTSKV